MTLFKSDYYNEHSIYIYIELVAMPTQRETRAPCLLWPTVSLLGFFSSSFSLPPTSFTWWGRPALSYIASLDGKVQPSRPSILWIKSQPNEPGTAVLPWTTSLVPLVAIAIPTTTENHFDHLFGAIDMRPRENQFPPLSARLTTLMCCDPLCKVGGWAHATVAGDKLLSPTIFRLS